MLRSRGGPLIVDRHRGSRKSPERSAGRPRSRVSMTERRMTWSRRAALHLGRWPQEIGRKSSSRIGSRTTLAACSTMTSRTIGMRSERTAPTGFGIPGRAEAASGGVLPAQGSVERSPTERSAACAPTSATVSRSTAAAAPSFRDMSRQRFGPRGDRPLPVRHSAGSRHSHHSGGSAARTGWPPCSQYLCRSSRFVRPRDSLHPALPQRSWRLRQVSR